MAGASAGCFGELGRHTVSSSAFFEFPAIAIRLEVIASRLEAIASRFQLLSWYAYGDAGHECNQLLFEKVGSISGSLLFATKWLGISIMTCFDDYALT